MIGGSWRSRCRRSYRRLLPRRRRRVGWVVGGLPVATFVRTCWDVGQVGNRRQSAWGLSKGLGGFWMEKSGSTFSRTWRLPRCGSLHAGTSCERRYGSAQAHPPRSHVLANVATLRTGAPALASLETCATAPPRGSRSRDVLANVATSAATSPRSSDYRFDSAFRPHPRAAFGCLSHFARF
jgi:hypothetical protein